MRLEHLRGRKVCDLVLRRGATWKGKTLVVRWLPGPPRHPASNPARRALYVGTFASAKLEKSAVKRNRMRRRCREALRILTREVQDLPTTQLLLCPRAASLEAPFDEILTDVRTFLATLARRPQ